jgi:ribosomal protein L3 glutamine methyltransferase
VVATPETVRDYVLWAEQRFEAAGLWFGHGTDNALDDAAWLVCGALDIDPATLDDYLDTVPDAAARTRIETLVTRRIESRKPVAYLLQEAWFAGYRFYVDERVLIPRSLIGEYILEHFQPWIAEDRVRRVLDLCTGSGCIAIAIAHEFPQARVDATDISKEALAVAAQNIALHAVQDRVTLIESDVFDALAGKRYDLIVSNPPYVPAASMAALPDEYRHEPALALHAEDEGLAIVDRILAQAAEYLEDDGILMVEVGESRELLEERYSGWPFTWLAHASGEETVFLLTKSDLVRMASA